MKIYQQLNEQRTQGEWKVDGDFLETGLPNNEIVADFLPESPFYATVEDRDSKEARINLEYTALAVNNLHHLAEALDKLIEANRKGEAQGTNWINAQQALSRIS